MSLSRILGNFIKHWLQFINLASSVCNLLSNSSFEALPQKLFFCIYESSVWIFFKYACSFIAYFYNACL